MGDKYKLKNSVVVVFTGEGKGKTSASLGMMTRALGAGWYVAYFQFIKKWRTNEQNFIDQIKPTFGDHLVFYQGGAGFYNAGDLSAKNITKQQHKKHAELTFQKALLAATSGKYQLVICDEINNAVSDGLLDKKKLAELMQNCSPKTSLCLTGRNFPAELITSADIVTDMTKIKHHYDDKFLALDGIDY